MGKRAAIVAAGGKVHRSTINAHRCRDRVVPRMLECVGPGNHADVVASYFISTDKSLLDHRFVVRALQSTYWASSRPADVITRSIDASLCFGAYETGSNRQVGFTRIVTDGSTFSWLCDVYVDPTHRGNGLGERLVAEAIGHPDVAGTRINLATRDAHGLYERFGFRRFESMRRAPEASSLAPAGSASTVPGDGATATASPVTVVQRQLDAYNAHDVESLVGIYAADAKLFEYPDKLLAAGSEAIRQRFTERFKDGSVRASLLGRIVCGEVIIDHERVRRTFPEGPGTVELVATYRVAAGRIVEARFVNGPVVMEKAGCPVMP